MSQLGDGARVTTSSPLWDWAEVAEWLFRHRRISREEAIEAGVVSAANELLEGDIGVLPAALEERAERIEMALA